MNTNKYIKYGLLTIALALFGQLSFAQEVVAADTIDTEEAFGKKHIPQVPLEQCEQIDTCSIAKFAIVSKDGKLGIYDLEKHENVTEINLDVAGFSRRYVSEDGIEVFYFYVEKGVGRGTIGVVGENNQTVGVWVDNPEYVAKLDECTTIDSVMTCRQALIQKSNVAMFKILLVNRGDNAFGIWKQMNSDEKQTNAMELAALFNGTYQKNILAFPTLQGDSVTEETFDNITPLGRKYLQEVLFCVFSMLFTIN